MAELRQNSVKKHREFYAGYKILNRDFDRRNLDAVIEILGWCSRNMRSPKMMHFVLEIEDDQLFETNRFTQKFKEKFNSYIRQRNRERNKEIQPKRVKLPELQMFFSVESKYLNFLTPIPYLHLHLMVVIDTNHADYGHKELSIAVSRALSDIHGLESLSFNQNRTIFFKNIRPLNHGFLKFRNPNSSIKIGEFQNLYWHDLKTELPDAVCRASYLCKLDQKDMLPDKFKRGNSFGHTRPKKHPAKVTKLPANLTVGTQLEFL